MAIIVLLFVDVGNYMSNNELNSEIGEKFKESRMNIPEPAHIPISKNVILYRGSRYISPRRVFDEIIFKMCIKK